MKRDFRNFNVLDLFLVTHCHKLLNTQMSLDLNKVLKLQRTKNMNTA